MAAFQNFRSALNGFHREDVVRYIEYINNKHTAQVNALNTEIQTLQEELAQLRGTAGQEDLQARNAALEQELVELKAQLGTVRPQTDSELEAYRRAERAERLAVERVASLYAQANGALADASLCTDEAASKVSELTDRLNGLLTELQAALATGKNSMKDAAAAMYAIRPVSSDE